jgi:integrase
VKGAKRDAEVVLVQLLHQRDSGIDQPPGKISVGEYLQRWLRDYAEANTGPATLVQYESFVRRHLIPALGNIPLAKLRPQHIQAYYSHALRNGRADGKGGLLATTVLHHHRVLREALQHAVRWQLIARNPADAVEPPRPARHDVPALSQEVAQRLLEAANATPYGSLAYVAIMTGLRRGELLGLHWQDLDLEAGVLYVRQALQRLGGEGITFRAPKTRGSGRAVALSPDTVQRLRQHRHRQLEERLLLGPAYQDNGLVFTTPLGTPIDPANLLRAWGRIVKAAGLDGLRFHDLRHAHATLMLQQGVHPKVVSERLGHSGIRITMDTYSHVMPGLQAAAAAQLDGLPKGVASEVG